MEPGEKKGDLRISNPMGNMWVLLRWDGEFWRMLLSASFRSRDDLLRWAVDRHIYNRIVGDREFAPWIAGGATYQNKSDGWTLYTVRLGDNQVVAIGDATCHASPWPAPGVPSIGKGDKP